jgi:hypothetical protein
MMRCRPRKPSLPRPRGDDNRFQHRVGAKLGHEIPHVGADGMHGKVQLLRHGVTVRGAFRQVSEHGTLALRELVEQLARARRSPCMPPSPVWTHAPPGDLHRHPGFQHQGPYVTIVRAPGTQPCYLEAELMA